MSDTETQVRELREQLRKAEAKAMGLKHRFGAIIKEFDRLPKDAHLERLGELIVKYRQAQMGERKCRACGIGIPAVGNRYRCGPCHLELSREYYSREEVRARKAERSSAYLKSPATRQRLLTRVRTAQLIAAGRLIKQPCEVCGNAKVEAHHDDYSNPLDVRWLCRPHHQEFHNQARAARRKVGPNMPEASERSDG